MTSTIAVPLSLRPPALARPITSLVVGLRAEIFAVTILVAVALAARWPLLLLSPQFPSIGATIMRALDLADGHAFPLADDSPYIGAPFIYLLALAYKLVGPSVEVTLLVPWAIGGLTVIPTYLLGRELAGRAGGLFAGALLATAGAHIVVTSHVPLSHSLTPLGSTVTLWLLARAVVRRNGSSLAMAGLGAGFTLQTHPTVFPLLAGSAVAALLVHPAWLRTRWPYLAMALVVLGYGTLLAYHIQTNFAVIANIEGKQERYLDGGQDVDDATDRGVYLNNLAQLSLSLVRMASGAIDDRNQTADYLSDPWVLSYPALAVLGAVIAARRGNPLLLVALVLAVFWPPLLSGKYKPILDGRYLMPDLPVIFVDIAVTFSALAGLAMRSIPAVRVAGGALLFVLIMAMVLHPLVPLERFYEESQEDGFSNARYFQTLAQLRAAGAMSELVFLDTHLVEVKSPGGGKAGASFAWLLAVSRIPTQSWQAGDDPTSLAGHLAILERSTAEALKQHVDLVPLEGRRIPGRDRESYRAYRISTLER